MLDLVSPPPEPAEGEGRRAPCARALGPKLEALMERAEAAGWHPEEIAATVLAWAKGRGGGASLRDGTRPG